MINEADYKKFAAVVRLSCDVSHEAYVEGHRALTEELGEETVSELAEEYDLRFEHAMERQEYERFGDHQE